MLQSIVRGAMAALLLLSAGCLNDPLQRRYALGLAQQRYTQLIRWGQVNEASQFVAKDRVEEFRSWGPVFERLRVQGNAELAEFVNEQSDLAPEIQAELDAASAAVDAACTSARHLP